MPLVYRALNGRRLRRGSGRTALCLSGPSHAIKAVLDESAAGRRPEVVVEDDLATALTGADFVFSAIRVGGLRGRTRDERSALDEGLLGQETTGAGESATDYAPFQLRCVSPRQCVIMRRPRGLSTSPIRPAW